MKRIPIGLALLLTAAAVVRAQQPAASSDSLNLSPFGIGSDAARSWDLTKWVPQMSAIGLRVMRTCTPKQMDYLSERQFIYGGLLYGIPPGDTNDAPGTLPVKNLPAWSKYVSDYVRVAHGRVKYWEIWNEPPNGVGRDQTPADYAQIVNSAYDAARAVDPSALIGLAAKSAHVNYLDQVIEAGARDHFDYIVLHPYEVLGTVADNLGTESVYMHIVPTVRRMLAARDPAKANVPIIFTELGCSAEKGGEVPAQALVKAYAMGITEGVACIQWFEGIDGDSGPMGLLQGNGTPRPAYTAMAQMIKHLGQHPVPLGWVLFHERDFGFVFQGAEGKVLVAWAAKGGRSLVAFGKSARVVDPLTGGVTNAADLELTGSPILVLDPPERLIKDAPSNLKKPFPWGGDYTGAKSVSIVMGPTNIESGLHTLSAESVARDVVAYGNGGRGDVPGGNVFVVDPNFMSYTPEPIEISVVVRRNPANDNAGFKLDYESRTGYKNFGWHTIPDNKQWHTMKWTIRDAQFVNMWGFSFSLNSDGNQYNKYYIQSVTVRKL